MMLSFYDTGLLSIVCNGWVGWIMNKAAYMSVETQTQPPRTGRLYQCVVCCVCEASSQEGNRTAQLSVTT